MEGSSLIIHVIDSLAMGGAEVLLKNTTKLLPEYKHLVVYLNGPETLKKEFNANVEFICLRHRQWKDSLKTIKKLRRIFTETKPVLIHSNLFNANLFTRLAAPKHIPVICSLHSSYSIDAFGKNRKSLWVEKLTLKKKHTLIAVSKFVLDDYLKFVPFDGKKFVLYNFLPDDSFTIQPTRFSEGLRCVAVSNLKVAKNYSYLLKVFSDLKNSGITLDIYGEGDLKDDLQKEIDENDLPVRLLGKAADVKNLFKDYDLFVQASSNEGFGISVIEPMAAKLPVLISDIPVFREITSGHAHFFPLDDQSKAAGVFLRLLNNRTELIKHVEAAFDFCQQHYSSKIYRKKLLSIYGLCLENTA